MALFWISFLIIIALKPTQGDDTKLLLVHALFRHGARAPGVLYPTDPYPAELWKEGLANLTLLGKKQHYALGSFFRDIYSDFITTSPLEVTVNSSDSDRCIRSALANIAAFYKPTPEWKFDDDVEWQPIPVNLIPKVALSEELSREVSCPQPILEAIRKVIFLRDQHEEMMDNLTSLTGRNMKSVVALFLLQDTLVAERTHGLILPPWAEYYWEELSSVAEQVFQIILESKRAMRSSIGPFLKSIVKDMVEKSSGGIPDIKVRMYSVHDYEVSAMLKILKVFNGIRPPFCAAVVFELREKENDEKVVRLFYLNSTTPEDVTQEPHVLILDGCSEYCPLEYFVDYTKNAMTENWKEECGVSNSTLLTLPDWLASILELSGSITF